MRAILLFAAVICLAGCTAKPVDPRVYQQDDFALPTPASAAPSQAADARAVLVHEFALLLHDLYPTYNDIRVITDVVTTDGGFALEASHSFLGPYAFAAGPEKQVIQRWVDLNRGRMYSAGIRFVYVGSDATFINKTTFF